MLGGATELKLVGDGSGSWKPGETSLEAPESDSLRHGLSSRLTAGGVAISVTTTTNNSETTGLTLTVLLWSVHSPADVTSGLGKLE
jgi:hypothetical protein